MIFKKISIVALTIFLFTSTLFSQDIQELPSGYFMVVAAYKSVGEGYASRYAAELNKQGFNADYGLSYSKNMYFVYINRYDDKTTAINKINSTREDTPFKATWVYSYKAKNPSVEKAATALPPVEEQEVPEKVDEAPIDIPIHEDSITGNVDKTVIPEVAPDLSRIILFEAREARTQEPVDVEITIFDPYKERELITMKSGETKRVEPPTNDRNMARVTTNSFGWRRDAVSFNFIEPITDSTNYFLRVSNDTLVLYFDMHRMRRGDIQTLLNVYYYPNSSIMRPVSKLQLHELLDMMVSNPSMKIKLHGHTNSNSRGAYTRLAENDTTFFKMTNTHEETNGSAKNLSYDRANTLKEYLGHHGVSGDRIEVTGWGGKKMIYDENSVAATRNIRVEVEVTQE